MEIKSVLPSISPTNFAQKKQEQVPNPDLGALANQTKVVSPAVQEAPQESKLESSVESIVDLTA